MLENFFNYDVPDDGWNVNLLPEATAVPRTWRMQRALRRNRLSKRAMRPFMRLALDSETLTNWHRNAQDYLVSANTEIAGANLSGARYVMGVRLNVLDGFDRLPEVREGRLSAGHLGLIADFEIGGQAQEGVAHPELNDAYRKGGYTTRLEDYQQWVKIALMLTVDGPTAYSATYNVR